MSSSQGNGHHHRVQDDSLESQSAEYVTDTSESSGEHESQSSHDHHSSYHQHSSSANTSPASSANTSPTSSPTNYAESNSS